MKAASAFSVFLVNWQPQKETTKFYVQYHSNAHISIPQPSYAKVRYPFSSCSMKFLSSWLPSSMASLHILKSPLFPPLPISQSKISRKSTWLFAEFDSGKRFRNSAFFTRRRLRVCCGVQEGDNQSNGKSIFLLFSSF